MPRASIDTVSKNYCGLHYRIAQGATPGRDAVKILKLRVRSWVPLSLFVIFLAWWDADGLDLALFKSSLTPVKVRISACSSQSFQLSSFKSPIRALFLIDSLNHTDFEYHQGHFNWPSAQCQTDSQREGKSWPFFSPYCYDDKHLAQFACTFGCWKADWSQSSEYLQMMSRSNFSTLTVFGVHFGASADWLYRANLRYCLQCFRCRLAATSLRANTKACFFTFLFLYCHDERQLAPPKSLAVLKRRPNSVLGESAVEGCLMFAFQLWYSLKPIFHASDHWLYRANFQDVSDRAWRKSSQRLKQS